MTKMLIVRFSSFGDIFHCMSCIDVVKNAQKEIEIHWLCRSEFAEVVALHPEISKVISYDRTSGLFGLFSLIKNLRKENYTYYYDAHNNLRSSIINLFLYPKFSAIRSKERIKRLLLFKLRLNFFQKPYIVVDTFIAPLRKMFDLTTTRPVGHLNFSREVNTKVTNLLDQLPRHFITLAPSAAWEMKKWPFDHWCRLIRLLPDFQFVVLGGPGDTYLEKLEDVDYLRVLNLAGKLSLVESCAWVEKSKLLISADTGLLHVADYLGVKTLALQGPTAFGGTSRNSIISLEVPLSCRPCTKDGRGRCSQKVYQKCMVDITPEFVAKQARQIIRMGHS